MPKYHCRVYVGPTLVKPIAAKFREAGLEVTIEGSLHVYCEVEGSGTLDAVGHSLLNRLDKAHGTHFGLGPRDIWLLPKT